MPLSRLAAYIDGFNLYYGMKAKGWRRFYWLDVPKLIEVLAPAGAEIVSVKYFTAMVTSPPHDPDKRMRQRMYVNALQARGGIQIVFGHYQERPRRCLSCGATWTDREEKGTDVNIATAMLGDAYKDRFDILMLVSADGDLAGPLTAIRGLATGKSSIVAFPPDRVSSHLKKTADGFIHISHSELGASLLPPIVMGRKGRPLARPDSWQ